MNGVNLRLASLKGACLRSCNLRYAIMAGTDLEVYLPKQRSKKTFMDSCFIILKNVFINL
jgi:uncharacterized protein YjbI with pentapeptide repeats